MTAKQKRAKAYFEELRKLIKKCPRGYKLLYDIDKGLFMSPEKADFDHGSDSNGSLMVINQGHYRPQKDSSDGYLVVVAEVIDQRYVDLAALSCNAVTEGGTK